MNIEQRKALEKIVKNTISTKQSDLYSEKEKKISDLENDLANKNRKEANQLVSKKIDLEKEAGEIEKKVNKLGFDIRYNEELNPVLPYEQKEKVNKEYTQKEKDLDKVETKLVAKVWGVESDFNSLLKDIERELSKF